MTNGVIRTLLSPLRHDEEESVIRERHRTKTNMSPAEATSHCTDRCAVSWEQMATQQASEMATEHEAQLAPSYGVGLGIDQK